jgi:CheY-like chemotaxis protein
MRNGPPDASGIADDRTSATGGAGDFAELGRISAELLHDLGSVLSVLEGRVALARSEAALGRSVTSELSHVQRDTRELRHMVTDILDELRGGARSPDMAVAVEPLIEEVVNQWVPTGPRVTTTLEASFPTRAAIPGPRTFFTRTLGNLLRNAGRHARSRIRITVRAVAGETFLETTVEDDGHGIEESLRPKIFQPLVAGRGGGMGLGLSFAHWAADRLGGSVEVRTSVDLGGAAFRLRVPLVDTDGDRIPRPGRAGYVKSDPLLPGARIAVVDDEPAVVHVLRRRLEAEGAQVLTPPVPAGDDLHATLRRLEEWCPAVILLDLNLGATSGTAVHEILERRLPDLARRVLFLSGDVPSDLPPGPPVVHKLVEWDELVGRILEVRERSQASPPR